MIISTYYALGVPHPNPPPKKKIKLIDGHRPNLLHLIPFPTIMDNVIEDIKDILVNDHQWNVYGKQSPNQWNVKNEYETSRNLYHQPQLRLC